MRFGAPPACDQRTDLLTWELYMVGVAQLVEHRIVDPVAVGSKPTTHPSRLSI